MRLFAPKYYKEFVCIADKCNHSCCIGWEIDIDSATAEKYSELKGGYGDLVKNSVDFGDIPHFKLAENDRCPHLNEKGLCKIILELGENNLCEICREHPRFYNTTSRGMEVGLGLACEEAGRIILSSDDYAIFEELPCLNYESEDTSNTEFDPIPLRNHILNLLADTTLSYTEKIDVLFEKYKVSPNLLSDEDSTLLLKDLEYLDPTHRDLFLLYSSKNTPTAPLEKICCRALAYFVYRHCSKAVDHDSFRAYLGFSLFCEKLFVSIAKEQNADRPEASAVITRIISEELEYSEDNTQLIADEFLFSLPTE